MKKKTFNIVQLTMRYEEQKEIDNRAIVLIKHSGGVFITGQDYPEIARIWTKPAHYEPDLRTMWVSDEYIDELYKAIHDNGRYVAWCDYDTVVEKFDEFSKALTWLTIGFFVCIVILAIWQLIDAIQ